MSEEKFFKLLNQITCIWCGKKIQGFYRYRIHARICPKRVKEELECPRCDTFRTWDVVEFYKHQLHCKPSREYLKNTHPDITNEQIDYYQIIFEKGKEFIKTNSLVVCSFCGYSAKDLVDLAKHHKSCQKKTKGLTYGMDTELLRRMLMPSLPLSDNFIYDANPIQVEKMIKGDLKAIQREFLDKVSAVLNTLSKCKKCGEKLEGAIEICNFCGKEIYQNVEWLQYQIKLAKSLMEQHLERFWKFALIVNMELHIDSVVRVFEHAIMVNFKGV